MRLKETSGVWGVHDQNFLELPFSLFEPTLWQSHTSHLPMSQFWRAHATVSQLCRQAVYGLIFACGPGRDAREISVRGPADMARRLGLQARETMERTSGSSKSDMYKTGAIQHCLTV